MARLYANENMPLPTVERLRELGHDVLTTYESGQGNKAVPDIEVLSFAAGEDRAVLTFNRWDFIRLDEAVNHAHKGIVVCKPDINFAALAERIDFAIKDAEQLTGRVVRVTRRQGEQVRLP